MDIKFIGTGEDAKAVIYYVTDYITKSQLKTHVAYAALAVGVKKASDTVLLESEDVSKAKRMLQKCAFSLIANQEMSAQQVAMYLLGHEDHFTSDTFANLYWPSFERHLERQLPSPECRYNAHVGQASSEEPPDVEATLQEPSMATGSDRDLPDSTEGGIVDSAVEIEGDISDDAAEEYGEDDGVDNERDGAEGMDDPDTEDVIVGTNGHGELIPLSNQVADYVYRGHELDTVCLWDFIAQTTKVRLTAAHVACDSSDESTDSDDDEQLVDDDNEIMGDSDDNDPCLGDEKYLSIPQKARRSAHDACYVDPNIPLATPRPSDSRGNIPRAEGFPDEDEDFVYTSRHRSFILDSVNGVFQDGIMELFPRLPALLAPGVGPGTYRTTMSRAGMRLRVLFLWRELAPQEQLHFNAQYAVAFYIASHPPQSAVHLAHTILRFMYVAIRTYILHHYDYDINHQPRLKSLAYQLDCVSSYGLAFFDNIHDVYMLAVSRARMYPRFRSRLLADIAVSTWPPLASELLHENIALRTFHKAASAWRMLSERMVFIGMLFHRQTRKPGNLSGAIHKFRVSAPEAKSPHCSYSFSQAPDIMSSPTTRRQGKNKAAEQANSPSPSKRPRKSTPSDKSSTTEGSDIIAMRITDNPEPARQPTSPGEGRSRAQRTDNHAIVNNDDAAVRNDTAPVLRAYANSGEACLLSTQSLSASLAQSTLDEHRVTIGAAPAQISVTDRRDEAALAIADLPDYVPDELLPRLQRLVEFREPAMNRYSLRCIPQDARWGIGKGGRSSQYDRFLCHDGKPLVVWMVGVVKYVHLTDPERFSIGLSFFSEEDTNAAYHNLYGRSKHSAEPQEGDSFTFIGKWVNSANRENEHTFDNVYNAVDRELRGWNAEARIPASRIQVSDIVVVECYVKRFKDKSLNGGNRGWNAWGVQYELLRIAQLYVGPGFRDELPPDSNAVI
ncbi:hypothetical protein ACG7TL_005134 [Trametes sanguinea]